MQNTFWKEQGIAGPRMFPVIGSSWTFFRDGSPDCDKRLTQEFGPTIGVCEFGLMTLLTSDVELAKDVMVKEFNNFCNRRPNGFPNNGEISDYMMTVLKDDQWRRVRSLLTPTFSTGKLKLMFQSIGDCSKLFVKNLQKHADDDTDFEAKVTCGWFTLDVIARAAFGIEVDSQNNPDGEYAKAAKGIINVNFKDPRLWISLMCPKLYPLIKLTGYSIINHSSMKFFEKVMDKIIETRQEEGQTERQDLMQLMINAHSDEYDMDEVKKEVEQDGITLEETTKETTKKKGLSKQEILAQGFIVFLAGYDTTSTATSLFLYNMAVHPDCQQKLQQEIDGIMQGRDNITYNDLKEMVYLDQCFQESMRLYPIAPRLEREVAGDCNVRGIDLKKGMLVTISVYNIHMNPDIWPEPEKYDPDRFSPEEKARHSPVDHMPFGYGPRNCIAIRLATMICKLNLAYVLMNFNIVTCEKTDIPMKFTKLGVSKPKNGIFLKVEKRTNVE